MILQLYVEDLHKFQAVLPVNNIISICWGIFPKLCPLDCPSSCQFVNPHRCYTGSSLSSRAKGTTELWMIFNQFTMIFIHIGDYFIEHWKVQRFQTFQTQSTAHLWFANSLFNHLFSLHRLFYLNTSLQKKKKKSFSYFLIPLWSLQFISQLFPWVVTQRVGNYASEPKAAGRAGVSRWKMFSIQLPLI